MTCIVGLKTKLGVFIAGDTFGSDSFTGQTYVRPKVFQNGDFVMGVCGSYRIMQLLEFQLRIPDKSEKQSIDSYLYIDFIEAVRSCLKEGGQVYSEQGLEHMPEGEFIFTYEGRLFLVQSDLSILEPKENYVTTGSGQFHAQASLYSTEGLDMKPEDRIIKAIECANNFVVSVNDNVDILYQPTEEGMEELIKQVKEEEAKEAEELAKKADGKEPKKEKKSKVKDKPKRGRPKKK